MRATPGSLGKRPQSGPRSVVLTAERVTRTFVSGRRRIAALNQVSLTVESGRVTGLIGPDAAGKTTFMRLAAGLLAPDSGRLTVFGLDSVRDALAVQASIGYMPQRFGLYEDLSVTENLDLYADLQGVLPVDRPLRYEELMNMTGLGPFMRRLAGNLSGGMKQKLGLACTLIRPPRLLLLDEPTVGVDPVSRRELWNIVYRMVAERDMAVLLSTAYMDEAERCSDVILLHEGEILDQGEPAAFSSPLRGRVFTASANIGKRRLQQELACLPHVVDAVIQGEQVRLVTDGPVDPPSLRQSTGLDELQLAVAEPRFEDAFVARLRQSANGASHPPPQAARSEGPTGGTVIAVEGLYRRFGDFEAVKDLGFQVNRGEVFGLLGANGAGKTTTFRMLCGLLPPSSGRISVAGVDLRRAAAAARQRIGYVAQKFALYGTLTVAQNLRFFATAYNLRGKHGRDRIAWAMKTFDLRHMEDVESDTLPLGYQQRLALACALMHEPEILFLDEATSGVDPLARREFWDRINELADRGVTILVTTHFMEEADYCDRLVIMGAGRLLAMGTPEEIKRRAQHGVDRGPTMEDAFIALIEAHEKEDAA